MSRWEYERDKKIVEANMAKGDYSNCPNVYAESEEEHTRTYQENVNLYLWREEVQEAVMNEKQCPSCKSEERNPAGPCHDCWHYHVPRPERGSTFGSLGPSSKRDHGV